MWKLHGNTVKARAAHIEENKIQSRLNSWVERNGMYVTRVRTPVHHIIAIPSHFCACVCVCVRVCAVSDPVPLKSAEAADDDVDSEESSSASEETQSDSGSVLVKARAPVPTSFTLNTKELLMRALSSRPQPTPVA